VGIEVVGQLFDYEVGHVLLTLWMNRIFTPEAFDFKPHYAAIFALQS
jgi:hypothetical protein